MNVEIISNNAALNEKTTNTAVSYDSWIIYGLMSVHLWGGPKGLPIKPVSNVVLAAVPDYIDRIKFDFSTAVARRLKSSRASVVLQWSYSRTSLPRQ